MAEEMASLRFSATALGSLLGAGESSLPCTRADLGSFKGLGGQGSLSTFVRLLVEKQHEKELLRLGPRPSCPALTGWWKHCLPELGLWGLFLPLRSSSPSASVENVTTVSQQKRF